MKIITLFISCIYFSAILYAQDPIQKNSKKDSTLKARLYSDTFPKQLSLQDIVVKGKKPPVSFKLDRQVFRAAEYMMVLFPILSLCSRSPSKGILMISMLSCGCFSKPSPLDTVSSFNTSNTSKCMRSGL